MAALNAPRNTPKLGNTALESQKLPLAVAKVFNGGIVGVNGAGYAQAGASGSNLRMKIVGICEAGDGVADDNSAGSAGDKATKVLRGTFKVGNSASTDALSQADVERLCYVADDQTVARTPALGARPVAGRVKQVDADGVWVDFTDQSDEANQGIDLLLAAGADLSTKQFFFVKQNASDQVVLSAAGEEALGVLQNAPGNAAIAVVRIFGKSRVIAGAAITQGVPIASDANGKAKTASRLVQATGAASCAMGRALSGAAGDLSAFEAFINCSGTRGTSDA